MWKGYHLSIEGIIKEILYLWRYPNLAVLTKTNELYLEEERLVSSVKISGILESLFFAVLLLQFIHERGTFFVKIGIYG